MYRAIIILISLVISGAYLSAQRISGRLSTTVYTWEKYENRGSSNVILRATQTVQLNGYVNNFMFRTYFAGMTGNSADLLEDGKFMLYNAVLTWNNFLGISNVNVGRIPVFAGVGVGTIDGLMIEGKFFQNKFFFKGYGGINVNSSGRYNGNGKLEENFSAGGQIGGWLTDKTRYGVSYINRRKSQEEYYATRIDSIYNPYTLLIKPPSLQEHMLGVDVLYDEIKFASLYGRVDYDFLKKNVQKGEFNANVSIIGNLSATANFIHREPRIFYRSFFSKFRSESIREYEGGLEYTFSPWVASFGRFALVKFHDDDGNRMTIGVSTKYGGMNITWTNGAVGSLTSISVDGIYPIINKLLTANAGVSYSEYKFTGSLSPEENAWSGVLGLIIRYKNKVSFDLQGQWMRNRVYGNDIRGFGKISYWFSEIF